MLRGYFLVVSEQHPAWFVLLQVHAANVGASDVCALSCSSNARTGAGWEETRQNVEAACESVSWNRAFFLYEELYWVRFFSAWC